MAIETRRLVFANQAAATAAMQAINTKLGIGTQSNSTTLTYAWPQPYFGDASGRWFLPFPTDDSALSVLDQTTYWVSPGDQPAPATGALTSTVTAPLSLRDLFTQAEVEGVTCAATKEMVTSNYTTAVLQVLMDTLDASAVLGLRTYRVQSGFAYLVARGFLTADRANAILQPVGTLPQSSWVATI